MVGRSDVSRRQLDRGYYGTGLADPHYIVAASLILVGILGLGLIRQVQRRCHLPGGKGICCRSFGILLN
jgi:hypothetical protein